ncbi:MAG TPA: FdhF/YdeP family oxidoreductase [Stenomitos sp.]
MESTREPEDRKIQVRYPEELSDLKLSDPKTVAGGLPAVTSALRHALDEMGPLRGAKALGNLNQKGGIDCSSCAWPDPDHARSLAEFCENGAKAIAAEGTTRRVDAAFFREWSLSQLSRLDEYWLGKQGRLTEPVIKRKGSDHYEPIGWDEAFELIARELRSLASPNEALFYTSGRTSNEAAFLYQLVVRLFGTNNLPDCSNMCHESSGVALKETLGIGKGTVTLDDFEQADAIFILGQNPGTNHPRMLTSLQAAARRGCRIVSINPLPEAGLMAFKHPQELQGMLGRGTPLATLHVPVRINGDLAFMKGLLKELLDAEGEAPGTVLDHAFIREHTAGFEALRRALVAATWDEIVAGSGVSRELIRQAARIALESKRTICCWAMGLTQHKNAVATIREVVNFLLLGGHVGRPGAGVCPVRGHSNVQGDRTMGIYERPEADFLERLGGEFGFNPPTEHGYDTVHAIQAMHEGKAKVFFAMGGNFLSATPDTEFTARALQKCRLTVQVSTKLNRSHVVTGEQALILPCLGRTDLDVQASGEQFVTTENSMGVISASHGKLQPVSDQLLSEPAIVARLGKALFGSTAGIDWDGLVADYDRIRSHIERVVTGFEGYNSRVRQDEPFYLPNGPRDSRTFHTATGKAHFTVNPLTPLELSPDQFLMMTIRSHDQFNTTIYGKDDRYRGIHGERRVIFMSPEDMAEFQLREGQIVDLRSHYDGVERQAPRFIVVPYAIPRRCVATYFPETNALVPVNAYADGSRTPISKSVVITVHPSS